MPKNEKIMYKVRGYEILPVDNIELRECPLCGAQPALTMEWQQRFSSMVYSIECTRTVCGLKLKTEEGLRHAVEKWNTRYEEQEAEQEPEKDP